MPTFLFDDIIFGPVKSRRLGVSLGINLLPSNRKVCSFDCIYCECGFNPDKNAPASTLPSRDEVHFQLENQLKEMSKNNRHPDVITFAGNGEPTLHPNFPGIIEDTINLRDCYCPEARIAVLSNATRIHSPAIFDALLKVDDNIQKLDSANHETVRLLDRPQGRFDMEATIENLKKFNGHVIIQTLFVRGAFNGMMIDNSTEEEISPWLNLIKYIAPSKVMVYTIARDTPVETLEKIPIKRLNEIAERVRAEGFKASVSA